MVEAAVTIFTALAATLVASAAVKGVMTLTALEVTPAASAEVTTTPSALGATLVASVAAVSPI